MNFDYLEGAARLGAARRGPARHGKAGRGEAWGVCPKLENLVRGRLDFTLVSPEVTLEPALPAGFVVSEPSSNVQ